MTLIGRYTLFPALAALALAGCALNPPDPAPKPALPAHWSAPLPHAGDSQALAEWWQQFDDPQLARLVETAQARNGELEQAAARIEEARANVRIAGAARYPSVDAKASATRSSSLVPFPTGAITSTSLGVDALWEIDLFGVTRKNIEAAAARAESAQATWHDLRVSLAAEAAATYVNLRACEQLADIYTQDTASSQRRAQLTEIKVKAGLESRANGALARAAAAEASNRLIGQRADCDVLVKALVVLTTLPEAELRPALQDHAARLPQPKGFVIDALPAKWLEQRPDLAALERQVLAASADVGASQGERYPRISLSGTVSRVSASLSGGTVSGTSWSIGPAVSLPLFDAGRRAAAVDAAQARYTEARARYEQRARVAVREVEEALVRLDAAARREEDARQAALGFREFMESAQARWDVGAGSLLDLEEARRNALNAAAALVGVQRERVAAWINLYKAVGGGWSP
jgi:NodT family efflux transporter outer membrane factor (OMF) lipoprotein